MKKVITFGEVMLRLSPPDYGRFRQADSYKVTYGGGEANVAVFLAQSGISANHVTCFPENDLGYAATDYLKRYGVHTENIIFKGERLGIYFLETGASMRASKVVYDRNYSAFAAIDPAMFNWEKILQGAQWFHWTGITPAISASAAQACYEAIQMARRMGVKVSADVTYRKNLWQYGKSVQEVMPKLVAGSDVVLLGEAEAEEIFTIQPDQQALDPFVSVSRQMMERYPNIQKVIATKRQTLTASHNCLSAMLWNGKHHLQTVTHDIHPIVDRIGGGDAFMAGFIYGTLTGKDEQQSLDFALAASALKHTIAGDANLATITEIEQLAKGDASGRLAR